jgi:hypothetical protein
MYRTVIRYKHSALFSNLHMNLYMHFILISLWIMCACMFTHVLFFSSEKNCNLIIREIKFHSLDAITTFIHFSENRDKHILLKLFK